MESDLTRRPRTKLRFSDEDWARLHALYYDRDTPMVAIAKTFRISTSTLYHWIAEMDWPRRSATFPIRTHPEGAMLPEAVEGTAPHPAGPYDDLPGPLPAVAGDGSQQRHRVGEREATPAFGGDLAARVLASAQAQIAALGDPLAPGRTPAEQNRRASLVASLSHSVDRVERALAVRTEVARLRRRVRTLEKELRDAPKTAETLVRVIGTLTAQLAQHEGVAPRDGATWQPEQPDAPQGRAAALAALTQRLKEMAAERRR